MMGIGKTKVVLPMKDCMQLHEQLLMDILTGRHEPGTLLPPERTLSQQLGVGRPALREALRRLESLGLVESRHGSGTRVRNWQETGTVELLPYYLAAGAPGADMSRIIRELLQQRIRQIGDVVRIAVRYAPDEAIEQIDEQVRLAWSRRDDPLAFAMADFDVYRSLARAAAFPPALWLLNSAISPYRLFLERFPTIVEVPEGYLEAMGRVVAAIKARDAERAVGALETYLESVDSHLWSRLGIGESL